MLRGNETMKVASGHVGSALALMRGLHKLRDGRKALSTLQFRDRPQSSSQIES